MRCSYTTAIRTLPHRPAPLPQVYQEFLELGVLAEDLGFHRVWLSEHHFAEDDWGPSPLLTLSALAARTRRIQLGTFVTLVAMHNPLRLAEDCATLDILSNGRFSFGFGAGGSEMELRTFGIDPKESVGRSYEALEIMTRCWTEDEFSHHGKYFDFENVRMRPKPVRRPIPIHAAALGPQSLAKSAQRGYNIVSALHSPLWTTYETLLRENGRDPLTVEINSGPLFIHVAESKEKAWDEAEEGMQWSLQFYELHGAQRGAQTAKTPPVGEFRKVGLAYGQPIPIGTPEDVLNALAPLKHAPLDELALGFGYPGMPHEAAKRAMEMFAKECMPEIRSWGRPHTR